MTAATIGKLAAAAVVTASASLGAFKAGRAAAPEPAVNAQSTISAPALTTADIGAVRDELRQLRHDTQEDIAGVRQELRELRKDLARRAP